MLLSYVITGLIFKNLHEYETSLIYFKKIQSTLSYEQHPQVICQIGNLYEKLNDINGALEWYHRLLGLIDIDAGIYSKIGDIYEIDGDRQQAYQYNNESYRIYPVNNNIINWICSHFIELQVAEKAINYFERSSLINPNDPNYILRISDCLNKIGNQQKSLKLLKLTNKKFPNNFDCLKLLLRLTRNLGLTRYHDKYQQLYDQAIKVYEHHQRINSGKKNNNNGSNDNSVVEKLSRQRSGKMNNNNNDDDNNEFIVTYSDPLGPMAERPKTGGVGGNNDKNRGSDNYDGVDDIDINPDELLPL